ncbi:hypothetical protein J437_LFUL008656 [Ladona fulva]|uniref:Chitin-binding type-4 domain-containing protein n=1 Tax=Ladona fulva TaxID=123851 RepID=A0A8K0K8K1_LADFU|nr:hypothetical protein J437_LFUL008656 [Ladona fulva]
MINATETDDTDFPGNFPPTDRKLIAYTRIDMILLTSKVDGEGTGPHQLLSFCNARPNRSRGISLLEDGKRDTLHHLAHECPRECFSLKTVHLGQEAVVMFTIRAGRHPLRPRAHESGGKYAQGIIVRRYKIGATVPIRVELTANHKGYFEFRLCPQNNHRKEATQACLDRYLLERGDSVGGRRVFPGIEGGGGNRIFEARYRLPDGLTCSQCVLQWRYVAGNSWGMCANGTGAVGCGPQEEFRACADVSIQSDSGHFDNTPYDGEGEEEEGEGEVDNEIPQGKEDAKSGKAGEVVEEEEEEEEEGLFWWGVVLLVVGCAFVAAAALFALLYLYYYHARDGFKKWLKKEEKRRIGVAVIVPIVPEEPPMVPPRRSRKSSFSGDERVV